MAVAEAGCRRGSQPGNDPEPAGIGAEDDRQAGTGREFEVLLRGRSDGLRVVLAADAQLGAACEVIAAFAGAYQSW